MVGGREYRVIRRGRRWIAQLRFTAPDDELWAQGIQPGWHGFKISVNREKAERAVELSQSQRQED
jgi:hypothetical protein